MTSDEIREITLKSGADRCGIAPVERFKDAPSGFNPVDIYDKSQSVIVFLKQMPTEIIMASNPIPYSATSYMLYNELDVIGLHLCRELEKRGHHAIPVPADTPYLYWDESIKRGQGILSLRHAAYHAGLGFLGRSNLLINRDLGNMVYIGAVLSDLELDPDPIADDLNCPDNCTICIDSCPQSALNGTTVDQKICREVSFYKNERGFDIYDCNLCRKLCPLRTGAS